VGWKKLIRDKFIYRRGTELLLTMPATSGFTKKDIKESIDEIIDAFFTPNPDSDLQHFSEAMVERVAFMFDQIKERHAKALKAAKTASASAAKPKATRSTASKSKSRSGERAANPYSSFMSLLKYVSGQGKDPNLANIEIKAEPNFSSTSEKSQARYQLHQDAIRHNDAPLHGQTVTLGEAFDAITGAHETDPMFKNAAVRTAILWAMLPAEQRAEIVQLGRTKALCN